MELNALLSIAIWWCPGCQWWFRRQRVWDLMICVQRVGGGHEASDKSSGCMQEDHTGTVNSSQSYRHTYAPQ